MLPFKRILCADYETYYDDELTLKKLDTTDYIRHPEFEVTSLAAQYLDEKEGRVLVGKEEIAQFLRTVDWRTTAFLGHHTHFDGLITTHHFGAYPCFWLDTLCMARCLLGVDVPLNLDSLAKQLGHRGKVQKEALDDVKGIRLALLSPEQIGRLRTYNLGDVEETIAVFNDLVSLVPEDEMRLIDITLRMYCEPVMLLDGHRLRALYENELERKLGILERVGQHPSVQESIVATLEAQEAKYLAYEAKGKTYAKPRASFSELLMKEMRSQPKFATHLESAGVEPPTKISARTKLETYSFSQQDLEFKALLEHPNELVRDLVEARLMSTSNITQTRSEKLLNRVGYPTPVYLTYFGARTSRWSGGDGVNWQNPPRRGPGVEIRKSLLAPKGTRMIIADASQIEARMNAWKAGQFDKLEVFARYDRKEGPDVYCYAAGGIYNRPIDKDKDKDERFVGKVFELAAGYQAGARKINYMFRVGAFGPPVYQEMHETEGHLRNWRQTNWAIVNKWYDNESNARVAFVGKRVVEDGCIVFEGSKRGAYIHLPNGTYIFYPDFRVDEEGNMCYVSRRGLVKLYGGIITENIIQALARVLLGQQMLKMVDRFPFMRIVTSTHDEVGIIVPTKYAEEVAGSVHEIMSTPEPWAAGVPLNADVKIATFYDKT